MPAITNLVVKKNDNTTDVTFTAVQPSSGDGTYANWRNFAVGTAMAHQPELRLMGRDVKGGSHRDLRSTFKYPQTATNTTTGVTSVIDTASAVTTWHFPKSMSNADVNEFVAQYAHLLATAGLKATVQSGFAPT